MQEQKNYILQNIKILLNLDEPPYQLTQSSGIEKFITSDQQNLIIECLSTKEFKIIHEDSKVSAEGSNFIYISKFKNDSSLKKYYNFSIKPTENLQLLSKSLKTIIKPVMNRLNDNSISQLKQLQVIIDSSLQHKLINEDDLNFNSFEQQFNYWQDIDLQQSNQRVSFFIKEYTSIIKSWKNINHYQFNTFQQLIQNTWIILKRIWNSPYQYHEKRFCKIINIFESTIKNKILNEFSNENELLQISYEIKYKIIYSIQCCKKFINIFKNYKQIIDKKLPQIIKLKIIQQLLIKIQLTYYIKNKIEFLIKLYQNKFINQNPNSLIFLLKSQNFINNYLILYKNNIKILNKIQNQKNKMQNILLNCIPIIDQNFKNCLKNSNIQYLFKCIEKWFYFFHEGKIIQKVSQYYQQVLKRSSEYIENLWNQYEKQTNTKFSLGDKLRILKAGEKCINRVNFLMKQFGQNSNFFSIYLKKQQKVMKELSSKQSTILQKFIQTYESIIIDKKEVSKILGKLVLNLSINENGIKYQTSPQTGIFIHETKKIMQLGYTQKLNKNIIVNFLSAQKMNKQNIFLKKLISRYNSIEGKLQLFERKMLNKQLQQIKQLIQNPKIRKKISDITYEWKDEQQLIIFINLIQTKIQKMIENLTEFNNSETEITQIAQNLLLIQFNPNNFFIIDQKIQQIMKIIHSISFGKNIQQWKQFWKYKLTEIICIIWKQRLINNIDIPITIMTIFSNNSCEYQPNLYEIKERYFKQFRNYIAWPMDNKHLYGKILIQQNQKLLVGKYRQIQIIFSQLNNKLNRLNQYDKLLSLDIDTLEQEISHNKMKSQELAEILNDLKQCKSEIQMIQDQDKINSISIDNTGLKITILTIIQGNIEGIIQLLKFFIKIQSEQVEDYINNMMIKLQSKPQNMDEMSAAIKQYESIQQNEGQIRKKIAKIQQCNNNIKMIAGTGFNTINMIKRWQNFQMASLQMNSILIDQKSRLQNESIKNSEGLQQQVIKLYKKYQKIKPSQDINQQEILQIYNRIKDWQNQWNQIQNKLKTIKIDLEHFNISMPKLNTYQEIKNKIVQQMGNWILFMQYRNQIQILQKQQWIILRGNLYKYNDIINNYILKIKQIRREDIVSKFFKEILQDQKKKILLLKCISGENFQKQHWGMLFSILKIKNVPSIEKLLVGDLLNSNLLGKANQIRQLQARAKGQITIRQALEELEKWGIVKQFELTDYNSMDRVTPLIREWKQIMTEVSDHQSLVLSIKQSKYASRFKQTIQIYEKKFGILDESLLKLNQIQRKWIYLEPIFMRGALPSEQGRWKRLDQQYRNIMNNVSKDPHVIELTNMVSFIQTLNNIMGQLQWCQKALNDFLEEKRNKFPRFYFLGDDDMLQILGQSQNPPIIQLHLKKLFSGIHTVKFSSGNQNIQAMQSKLKEEVTMNETIAVTDIVEDWLEKLSQGMVITLKKSLKMIKNQSQQNNFSLYSSQVICLQNEIKFSSQCTDAIAKNGLSSLKQKYQQQLSSLTKKCHETKEQLILTKIKSLILDVIHHISVIETLIHHKIHESNQWKWYKQMKFVRGTNDSVNINMANTCFQYTFQYQGNAQKLVYTPLTDKCYLTLTQAMQMGLGGNPYGPAGTGKTQSVKALALAFGRQVLVFNCDQGLDFHSMGRIFIGLVKCGAWGCFDEFNRLKQQQLSAISQQIQLIQQAIKSKQSNINLLGKKVKVNFNSGIFVTLNPAGKGYGGRSKLPDNLKQLFRPIAMSVPDNELIAEVLLYAEGFTIARKLAEKIITIFTLSRQLLSRQLHYDWGLRALKTVLTVAGRLIFEEGKQINQNIQSEILIKALRINTISKLTYNDMLKFNILVTDVFPGIIIKDIIYEQVSKAIKQVFEEEKFIMLPNQLNKILQFYEATNQRIGAVLVGPSGCGKTTIWKVLKKAYEKLNRTVKIHLINPKAMSRSSFLGYMNNDTRQFSEGVLTASARQVVKSESDVLNWIICDGDVDPQWIQALNSVLDDNHLLTLPTGERIAFGTNVNFIFQTDNLQFASPATISRMGMIFMNDEDININSIIRKWTYTLSQKQNFIKQYVQFIEDKCQQVELLSKHAIVSTTKVGLVRNACSLVHNQLSQLEFKLNLVKGLASNFDLKHRLQIFQLVMGKQSPGNNDPLSFLIVNNKITQYKDEKFTKIQKIYRTKQLQKDLNIVVHWLKHNNSIILVGKQGCGKSLLLQASLEEIQKIQKCKVITIHCNRETKSSTIIHKLFQVCQRTTSVHGKVLRPQNCSKQIIVLKQINLPQPDKYNTMQIITFLQSLITHQGFYDNNLEFIRISQGIQFVCLMKPSSTIGRFQLTTRFVTNLRVLKVNYQSVGTEQKLRTFTNHFEHAQHILQQFWKIINNTFKSDDNPHYLFAPRNLNSIVDNLQFYNIDINSKQQVQSAIYYEFMRQFSDRLVNESQKLTFKKMMLKLFNHDKYQNTFYSRDNNNNKLKPYSLQEYEQIIKKYIKLYQNQIRDIPVILVKEVVQLIASIQRKFVQGGSMLLAGSSGTLRRTSVRILAHQHKFTLCSLSNLRNPSLKDFYKDIRIALEQAGGRNKRVILFIQEHQLGRNEFYQKINSLISSGEIGGLFATDEIEGIIENIQQLRSSYAGKSLYQCFIERIKQNLIIILSLDHRNKQFAEICSSNPAFYSFCRIIWLNCYSKRSLQEIYDIELKKIKFQYHDEIKKALVSIHQGSSIKYLQLLNNFKSVFEKVISKSGNKLEKLQLGLKKLSETSQTVDELTTYALNKKKLLTVKQKQADQSLNFITKAMQQASDSKAQVQKLRSFLEVEQKKIEKDRIIVVSELEKVRPLIEEAKTAVSGLTQKNIHQIRSFVNPPEPVRHVLKAVLSLFGNKDDSWNSMKNFLKVCKDQILMFDIKQISKNIRIQVESIINQHAKSFQKQVIFRSSQDTVPLAQWVKAAVQYSKTYEKVRPLEENLHIIEKQLSKSMIQLNQCSQKVINLEATVKQLNNNFIKKTNEAEVLKQQLKKAEQSLLSGEQLLQKLQNEKVRWLTQSNKLKNAVLMMPRHTAMTACFITYLSSSPQNLRISAIQRWKTIIGCETYSFLQFLTSEANILQEVMKGLPNDKLSIQNSQILQYKKQIALIIDPHTQATNWLKEKLSTVGTVQTLTQRDLKFINTLQLAIRFGKTLIIQQIDYIEPMLTSILKKDYLTQGARSIIQIGQKAIQVNDNFHLYLITRNNSIDIPYHQSDIVSIINFSVTLSGLEAKLLSIIITNFQPQIEKQKQQLLKQQQKLKINLSNLQEKLLKQLADSSGNILENKALIQSLNQTKEQSQTVSKSLQESQQLQLSLDQKRKVYQTIASTGAKLYISLAILKKLNPMYKYNLSQFIGFFEEALSNGGEKQIDVISKQLVKIVYDNISISLMKIHRLLLAIVFVRAISIDKINDREFNVLLGNTISNQSVNIPKWVDPKDHENYRNFISILPHSLNFQSSEWQSWSKQYNCENSFPVNNKISSFQECLLIYACRPDRLMNSMSKFAINALQLQSLSSLQINMKMLTQQKMSNKTPCLFIVSIGFDPSKQIQQFAYEKIGKNRFTQLSMGGDQNDYALELLRQATKEGKWLCLKNLHLVIGFVGILEKQVLSVNPHESFRLFLTTQAHEKFPPILLQICYKVSYQAPPGLKQNFTRLLSTQSFNKNGSLQLILTYFHSLIQQRRNYNPQGWTKFYEFNYGDYKAGLNLLDQIKNKFGSNWDMLYGLMLDTIYGGRIDNQVDLRLLNIYIMNFFNQEMENGKKCVYGGLNIKKNEELIQKLPDNDIPQIYNLPKGFDKAILKIKSKQLIQNLKIVSLGVVQNIKFSREKWGESLTSFFKLWKGLVKQPSDMMLKKVSDVKLKSVDPIQSFVYGQCNEAIQNYQNIKNSLNKLEKVLFGNEILTNQIQDLGKYLLKGQPPTIWRQIWQGPDLVTEWLKIFIKKLISIHQWRENTQKGNLLSLKLNLCEVFRPQIFFNALKQKNGREKQIPVNQLKIKCSFSQPNGEICSKIKSTVLQGCSFVDGGVGPAQDDQYEDVPVVYIYFTNQPLNPIQFMLPFYTEMNRQTLLSILPVKGIGSSEKKIMSSAALILKDL